MFQHQLLFIIYTNSLTDSQTKLHLRIIFQKSFEMVKTPSQIKYLSFNLRILYAVNA